MAMPTNGNAGAAMAAYGARAGIESSVADASVMPLPLHGNTNAASVMIGARVADFILGR